MIRYIQWRDRMRSELAWSYSIYCQTEEVIDDAGSLQRKYININECFAPSRPIIKTNWSRRLYFFNNRVFYIRLVFVAISFHVLYIDITLYPLHNLWVYLFFLTHWGHLFNMTYLFCSMLCCANEIPVVIEGSERNKAIPNLIQITWLLYSTTAPLSLAICILYWIGIAPSQSPQDSLNYVCIMEHGIIGIIVLIDGVLVGTIPVRAKHYVCLLAVCISYLLWSLVNYILKLGNGDWGPTYDDDALYPVLNWGWESRRVAAIVSSSATIVLCPVLFWFVWMLSLSSFDSDGSGTEDINRCCHRGCCGRGFLFEGRRRPLNNNGSNDECSQYDTALAYNEMTTGAYIT